MMHHHTHRLLLPRLGLRGLTTAAALTGAAVLLASCGGEPAADEGRPSDVVEVPEVPRPPQGSLEWARDGAWRLDVERARDASLKPFATFEVFHIEPTGATLELWPGGGGWTSILAPVSAAQGGHYQAAVASPATGPQADELSRRFSARFDSPEVFGAFAITALGPEAATEVGALAEPDTIDAAFTVDDVAAWMALGFAERAFTDVFAVLKPGGWFGVVEARAPFGGAQDPGAPTGYVQEAYVRRLAEEAGFEFVEALELHVNPADSTDHPFGVWTLAPYRLTAPLGASPDPTFDRVAYDAIGEPDRMTLLFRKPLPPEPAPEPDASDDAAEDDETEGAEAAASSDGSP